METASYLFLFVAGAELAIHRVWLRRMIERLSLSVRWTLFAISLFLLNARWNLFSRFTALSAILIWIGAIAIVALISSPGPWSAALQHPGLRWLGKVSYSLYLVHFFILFSLLYTLHGRVATWGIAAASVPLSLFFAALFHSFVEIPALDLGRKLERRFRRRLVAWEIAA